MGRKRVPVSYTVRTAKEWRNACVEEPTARNLNRNVAFERNVMVLTAPRVV